MTVAAVAATGVWIAESFSVPSILQQVSLRGFLLMGWIPGFGVQGTTKTNLVAANFVAYYVIWWLLLWVISRVRRKGEEARTA